jgi:glycine cleavage system H protein
MPISGEVYEVNELLEDNPELLNEDPLKNYIIVLTGIKEEELKDLILK